MNDWRVPHYIPSTENVRLAEQSGLSWLEHPPSASADDLPVMAG